MNKLWNGKKVLVTGHTGFVGAWMCAVLQFLGADITGFALQEEKGALYGKIKEKLSINSIYGDLRNTDEIYECIKINKPEIVFHIAAFGFVKECYEDSDRAYSSNVQGTLNLFQAIKECGDVRKIVVASSDKVYLNTGKNAYLFREEDPLGGMDIYSASKTCEDILVQSYFDTYLSRRNKSVCIVRPSNILGGGDHNITRLIPSIYYNLKRGIKPEIRNPTSVRPWQNVLDMVDAYLSLAMKSGSGCTIYNVGPEHTGIRTVGEIADYVMRLYKVTKREDVADVSKVKEKVYLGLSIDKIKKEIGWGPKRSLEQTLDEIYDFYEQDDGLCTYDLCMKQIKKYFKANSKEGNDAELEQ